MNHFNSVEQFYTFDIHLSINYETIIFCLDVTNTSVAFKTTKMNKDHISIATGKIARENKNPTVKARRPSWGDI